MMRRLAIAASLFLWGCEAPQEQHFASFAASEETVDLDVSGPDGLMPESSNWDQNISEAFGPFAPVVAATPVGESGQWGDIVFHITRVYQAASDRTCREVQILYPDNPKPVERLACGSNQAAFFATVIF